MMIVENGRYLLKLFFCNIIFLFWLFSNLTNNRFSQIGVVSYGSECPSHGVYARVTEAKHWIQYITEGEGAVDTNCNQEIPFYPGNFTFPFLENNISFSFSFSCVAKISM